jgi:hypothetical protein
LFWAFAELYRLTGAEKYLNAALPLRKHNAGFPDASWENTLTNAEDGVYPKGLGARGYVDDAQSYASNEYAIDYNAPLVFLAGYFMK